MTAVQTKDSLISHDFPVGLNSDSGGFSSDRERCKVGLNYYVYVNNNPVNFVDPTGLAPRNLSEEERERYKEKVIDIRYSPMPTYDSGDRKGQEIDCADMAVYTSTRAASAATGKTVLPTRDGELINNNSVHSSDFAREDSGLVTFYRDENGNIDNSFDSSNVEAGTIGVFSNHIIVVTEDRNSVTDPIATMQGHMKDPTSFEPIPHQADLDSYRGEFIGWAEYGQNSTSSMTSPEFESESSSRDRSNFETSESNYTSSMSYY